MRRFLYAANAVVLVGLAGWAALLTVEVAELRDSTASSAVAPAATATAAPATTGPPATTTTTTVPEGMTFAECEARAEMNTAGMESDTSIADFTELMLESELDLIISQQLPDDAFWRRWQRAYDRVGEHTDRLVANHEQWLQDCAHNYEQWEVDMLIEVMIDEFVPARSELASMCREMSTESSLALDC